MKRFFFTILFCSFGYLMFSQIQENITGLTQRVLPQKAINKTTAIGDTINLPIFDDFTGDSPYPKSKYWVDQKVFINSTHSLNPLSIGVATFDGLDEYGFPYHSTDNGSDTLADVLTSKHIDLTSTNNVFLSFYYQGGGLGESPGLDDSLVVEFMAPADSIWDQVWATKGIPMDSFRPVIIKVTELKYYGNGFKFRIGAYGAKNGAFDIWNIDYVNLEANRVFADSLVDDPTFSKPLPSFVNGYESVPWFHYNQNIYKDTIKTTIRKNGSQPMSLSLNQFRIYKDGTQVYSNPGFFPASLPFNQDIINPLDIKNYNPNPITNEFTLEAEAFLPGTSFGDYLSNDTLRGETVFKNYYAYDDGSAERAYGILNTFGARIAFRLDPLIPDTLKGVYFRFAHAGVDATQYTFKIGIWENTNGAPGNEIYISDSNYTPDYGYFHNSYIPYLLDSNIKINGSVFIGIRQNTEEPIYFGLDMIDTNDLRINQAMELYYGTPFFWYKSLAKANVMMRPFFKYAPLDISVDENKNWNLETYPNPAKGTLYLNASAEVDYRITDLTGRVIKQGTTNKEIDLHGISQGLYIFTFINSEGIISVQKINIL